MLEMRPDCEACGKDLHPDSLDAVICSFECSFCSDCAARTGYICPNCGGELCKRPTRLGSALMDYPASQVRRYKAQ